MDVQELRCATSANIRKQNQIKIIRVKFIVWKRADEDSMCTSSNCKKLSALTNQAPYVSCFNQSRNESVEYKHKPTTAIFT
jgi:hypothetical protein